MLNSAVAAAFVVYLLAAYWPLVKLFDLSRADLMIEGAWIGGYAKQITAVTPGGVADRADIRVGDVLEFDPGKDADWVLAGYRQLPEGFSASLPVRRADGSRTQVDFVPQRVEYLPTLNDRLALLARLVSFTVMAVVGVFMVWARPGLMTWSLLLAFLASAPARPWLAYFLAVEATEAGIVVVAPALTAVLAFAIVPFALCFPRDALTDWAWWKRALGLMVALAWIVYILRVSYVEPFGRDWLSRGQTATAFGVGVLFYLAAIAALAHTYRRSDPRQRARLQWALLGMSAALAGYVLAAVLGALPFNLSSALSGSGLTPANWLIALCLGVLFPVALGYAILRQRVIDVQFAVSRTLVYGVVSTLALAFMAAVHWLLGRLIEQTHLTLGIEGLAAVGLGLVLHKATHGINLLVDRVLFSKHHQAEQRLRQVTAALPYATTERSIAEALVIEPVRNLNLSSAALFYRPGNEGPLRRVLAHGWTDDHLKQLDAEALLVRHFQDEHEPLKLNGPAWLPDSTPGGAALPVLAIPIVNQHELTAVVLYGAHTNATLPDPDEVVLLQALAKAAATSHQRVRIATQTREIEDLRRRISQLEVSSMLATEIPSAD